MEASAAILAAFGAAAVALAHRRRRLVTAALVLSPALVMPTVWTTAAAQSYFRGDARVWVGGLGDPAPYGLIDRDTRIPLQHWGCMGPPAHAPLHNGVLRALARLAPAPNTFQGSLPTAREVRDALATSGEALRPICRGERPAPALLGDEALPCSVYRVSDRGEPLGQRIVELEEGLVAVEEAPWRLDLQEHPEGCASPGAGCPVFVVHLPSRTVLGSPPTHRHLAQAWQREDRLRRGVPESTGLSHDFLD